jgi:hypothetical protein
MKKTKKIKVGLLITFLAIPTPALAAGSDYMPGPKKSMLRGITAPFRKLQGNVQKAFQHPVLIIDSEEFKRAEENGINIDEMKEYRADKFCKSQGFEFAKEIEFKEATNPVTAYRYSPGTGSLVKVTVHPVLKDQYLFHGYGYEVNPKVITKEEYDKRSKETRNGEANSYLSIEKVPAPSILMTATCSLDQAPDQEWGDEDPLYTSDRSDDFSPEFVRPQLSRPRFEDRRPEGNYRRYEESPVQTVRRSQLDERVYSRPRENRRPQQAINYFDRRPRQELRQIRQTAPVRRDRDQRNQDILVRIFTLLRAQGESNREILNQLRSISARLESNKDQNDKSSPNQDLGLTHLFGKTSSTGAN